RRSGRGREYHPCGAPMRRTLLVVSLLLAACAARRVGDVPAPAAAPAAAVTPKPAPVTEASAATASKAPSTEAFEATVRPMLARTCTPCHVPGGKMYERLPFDQPDVVRSKQDSILKRLKAPEDRQALEDWLRL